MEKEQQLYDNFVQTLLNKLQEGVATPKELEIVMNFLKNNNIQASSKHSGLSELANEALDLPFSDEEMPLKRIK